MYVYIYVLYHTPTAALRRARKTEQFVALVRQAHLVRERDRVTKVREQESSSWY
jgi:hypothetical protein